MYNQKLRVGSTIDTQGQWPRSNHASTHVVGLKRERPVASAAVMNRRQRTSEAQVGESRVYSEGKSPTRPAGCSPPCFFFVATVLAAHWPAVLP
jgi:hypothetical protein